MERLDDTTGLERVAERAGSQIEEIDYRDRKFVLFHS
jgi:hypothetical protein